MYSNPTYNEKFNLAKNFIDNKEFNKAYDLLSSISVEVVLSGFI